MKAAVARGDGIRRNGDDSAVRNCWTPRFAPQRDERGGTPDFWTLPEGVK